jgi:hypothetical protein
MIKAKFVILGINFGGWLIKYNTDGVVDDDSFSPEIEFACQFETYGAAEETLSIMPIGCYQIDKIFIRE